jgi:hypothetical protein
MCREWRSYFDPCRQSLLQNPLEWAIKTERLELLKSQSQHDSCRRLLCEKYQQVILSWDPGFFYLPRRSFSSSLFFALGIHNVSEKFLQQVWHWTHSQSSYSSQMENYHAARLYQGDKDHLRCLISQNETGIFSFKMSLDYTLSFPYWIERHHLIDKEKLWRVLGCVCQPELLKILEDSSDIAVPWTTILQYALFTANDSIQHYILEHHGREISWDAIIDFCLARDNIECIEKCFDYGLSFTKVLERLQRSGKIYTGFKRNLQTPNMFRDVFNSATLPEHSFAIPLNI